MSQREEFEKWVKNHTTETWLDRDEEGYENVVVRGYFALWQVAQAAHVEEVERLQQRIAELEQALQWQPINTVPVDQFVDLWFSMPEALGGGTRVTNCCLTKQGKWIGGTDKYPFMGDYSALTHWMPLPKLPKALEGKP